MKKKGNISIKAKLLGIIIPVVIAIILILVFTAYHVSSGIIESYSKNLLESSVNSQASKIEAWLEENLASMQMAKNMIEKLHPDEAQLQTIWMHPADTVKIIRMVFSLQMPMAAF